MDGISVGRGTRVKGRGDFWGEALVVTFSRRSMNTAHIIFVCDDFCVHPFAKKKKKTVPFIPSRPFFLFFLLLPLLYYWKLFRYPRNWNIHCEEWQKKKKNPQKTYNRWKIYRFLNEIPTRDLTPWKRA